MEPGADAAPIRALGGLLALASLGLLACALAHPVLPLTPDGDLTLIAATAAWSPIHLGLLFSTGGIIAGIWALVPAAPPEHRLVAVAAAALVSLGLALNGVNIAFMLGAAPEYARLYAAGMREVAVSYQAAHLAVVMAGRLGATLVSFGAALWAWQAARRAEEPRWIGGLAALAAAGGMLGAVAAPPGHPLMLAGVGLLAVWGVAMGWRVAKG
ncbi:MAG TPA: hypothetical protein VNJ71_08510 [Gemmatimonadales bacterium]|jgi:hypothetical protein|nr:hypothetical protein [Gemmatimonadales bacterium]